MVNPNLPLELLIEIFSRLPTKSVGRCRCLSKECAAQLSTPEFLRTHIALKSHQENLIFVSRDYVYTLSVNGDPPLSMKLNSSHDWLVAGTCDGLALFVQRQDMCLVNPVTLQQVRIPQSPLHFKPYGKLSLGFGRDASTGDYKIVRVASRGGNRKFVELFYVKSGVWRSVGGHPRHYIWYSDFGVYLNGSVHWPAVRRVPNRLNFIAVFDFVDERFKELRLPVGLEHNGRPVVSGKCLCMDNYDHIGATTLWIMKEYGVEDSWTKLRFEPPDWCCALRPLCTVGPADIVLIALTKKLDTELLVYNQREETFIRNIVVGGFPAGPTGMSFRVRFAGNFSESLVSPALGDWAELLAGNDGINVDAGYCKTFNAACMHGD